jgi:hypothetical protein
MDGRNRPLPPSSGIHGGGSAVLKTGLNVSSNFAIDTDKEFHVLLHVNEKKAVQRVAWE